MTDMRERGDLVTRSLRWIREQLDRDPRRPAVIGLSAPQGSGKTTLVRTLVPGLASLRLCAVSISIDDFYLRREEQVALAAANPHNRILEHRGAPGTHDVSLGVATLDRLSHLGKGETMRVPAYDKTAHGGRGDRAPEEQWPVVKGPLDVILFEGWCWAFQPLAEASGLDPDLVAIQAALPRYRAWQDRAGALMAWRAERLESIVAWRIEAEARTRAEGRPALDAAAAEDYIRRFLPVYTAYQDTITRGPWGEHVLAFTLGEDRLPIG
jgi:D-glycerate 3-kinase